MLSRPPLPVYRTSVRLSAKPARYVSSPAPASTVSGTLFWVKTLSLRSPSSAAMVDAEGEQRTDVASTVPHSGLVSEMATTSSSTMPPVASVNTRRPFVSPAPAVYWMVLPLVVSDAASAPSGIAIAASAAGSAAAPSRSRRAWHIGERARRPGEAVRVGDMVCVLLVVGCRRPHCA